MSRDFLQVDTRQIKAFERALEAVGQTTRTAERRAINTAAFMARGEWQAKIDRELVQRNQFTRGSIRVEQARRDGEPSVVGSIAPYMDEQEFGGSTKRPYVTPSATGEGDRAYPRRKYPTLSSPNRMKNIRLRKGPMTVRGKSFTPKTIKQEVFLRVREAVSRREKYIMLDIPGKRGVYRLDARGGGPIWNPERTHGPGGIVSMKMIYAAHRKQLRIPRHATLAPVIQSIEKRLPVVYRATMQKMIVGAMNKALKRGDVNIKGLNGKFRSISSIPGMYRADL